MAPPLTTPEGVRFTSNYSDESNRFGFQFEFRCDRCRCAFRTPFKPSVIGGLAQAMTEAGSIFGGIFGRTAHLGEKVRGAVWKNARDAALAEAIAHVLPQFQQCPKCLSWVCRKACWNLDRGLCKKCAPDLAVEMAAEQAQKGVKAVLAAVRVDAATEAQIPGETTEAFLATCHKCEAPLAAAEKFCPNCGVNLKTEQHCAKCGTKLPAGAKFCTDCGTKTPG